MSDHALARRAASSLVLLATFGFIALSPACGDGSDPDSDDARWESAFDTSETGTLSGVWGSGPDDVFIVGGKEGEGEIYHYDGSEWSPMETPGDVPFLVWIYGFGPDEVFAVGRQGAVLRYDGGAWTQLDSGSNAELWGVFGSAADDLWIVGEDESATPVILHYDGSEFSEHELEENSREASALFKVWGAGERLVSVGEHGTIAEWKEGTWSAVSTGAEATENFVSLWGSGPEDLIAVGGQSRAQIATSRESGWTTTRFPQRPALNGVYVDDPERAIVVGAEGFLGRYDVAGGELIREPGTASLRMHAVWGDGQGRYYGVGGTFAPPHRGEAYVRVND